MEPWQLPSELTHTTKKRSVSIGRADSYAARWSDHAPVTAEFA